jgi:Rha family phage regulatory protein
MSKKQLMIPLDEATRLIQVEGGEPTTTSLIIAEEFGRRHNDVLREIESLAKDETIDVRDFAPISYIDTMNREQRAYKLNERSALTAMPFIGGKKSREGQKRLVDGFLAMRKELTRRTIQKHDAVWQQARLSGKIARIELTDAVQEFVEYAHAQGSTNARMYYSSLTLMEYRALFMIGKAAGEGFRDKLTALQSSYLTTAESIAQRALREGMTKELHYKGIYALAKERVEHFAAMIGKSHPGDGHLALAAA